MAEPRSEIVHNVEPEQTVDFSFDTVGSGAEKQDPPSPATLRQVDNETGIYVDDQKKQWASIRIISSLSHKDKETIQRLVEAENIPTIEGPLRKGTPMPLYNMDLVEQALAKKYGERPTVDKETGVYQDPQGLQWATLYRISELHKVGYQMLKSLSKEKSIRSQEGIDSHGHIGKLYLVSEVMDEVHYVQTLPTITAEELFYVDKGNQHWGTIRAVANDSQVGWKRIVNIVEEYQLPSIEGLIQINFKKVNFYNLETIKNLLDKTPMYDGQGLCTDENQETWATYENLLSTTGIGMTRLRSLLRENQIRSMKAFGLGGERSRLVYNLKDVQAIIDRDYEYIARKISALTDSYVDNEGKNWVTITHLQKKYHRDAKTFQRIIQANQIPTITGAPQNGNKIDLYSLEAIEMVFSAIPAVDPETGLYCDNEGKKWSNFQSISNLYGVGQSIFERLVVEHNAPFIEGYSPTWDKTKLYSLDILEEPIKSAIEQKSVKPHVDKDTGVYTDEAGKKWSSRKMVARILEKDPEFVDQLIKNHKIGFIEGFSFDQPSKLYNLDTIKDVFEDLYKGKPTVDKETGMYVGENGDLWCTPYRASQELGVGRKLADTIYAKNGLPTLDGLDNLGRAAKLVNFTKFQEVFNDIYKGKPWADKETKIFTDANGVNWTYLRNATGLTGKSESLLLRLIKSQNVASMEGCTPVGTITTFYDLDHLCILLDKDYGDVPEIRGEDYYRNEAGKEWSGFTYLAKVTGRSRSFLECTVVPSLNLEPLDVVFNGHRVKFWPIGEVLESLKEDKNLPITDKESGFYTDESGRRWTTLKNAAVLVDKSESVVKRLIERDSIPSQAALSGNAGTRVIIFDFELIEKAIADEYGDKPVIDQITGKYVDGSGLVWSTTKWIGLELKKDPGTAGKMLADFGIRSMKGLLAKGRIVDLFCFSELQERLEQQEREAQLARESRQDLPTTNRETGIYEDEKGHRWAGKKRIAAILGAGIKTINSFKLDSIEGFVGSRPRTLYSLDQAEEQLEKLRSSLPAVDPETGIYQDETGKRWATLYAISNMLAADGNITNLLDSFSLESIQGRDAKNIERTLYNLDQAHLLYERYQSLPKVDRETGVYTDQENGSRWAALKRVAKLIHPQGNIVPFLAAQNLNFISGIDASGREAELFSIDQAERLYQELFGLPKVDPETGIYTSPEDRTRWATIRTIAKILKPKAKGHHFVSKYDLAAINGLDSNNHLQTLCSLDQAEEKFRNDISQQERVKEYISVVSAAESQKIFLLFGLSNHSDILHLLSDKDFEAVPEKERMAILRDYLGDTMLERAPLRSLGDPEVIKIFKKVDELDEAIKAKMAFNLLETVIKNGTIDLYSEMVTGNYSEDDFVNLVLDWFAKLQKEAGSEFLNYVLDQGLEDLKYITSYEKPAQIVDRLGEDRNFPDFYQKVNIAGIRKKRKLLIADEMGMGKSASAIFAKETLADEKKVKSALLVVPSNVVENGTWQNYLSAHSAENPKGYFKEGQEPRVFVVNSISDLDNPDLANEYDYVILSHERLSKLYLDKLVTHDFDMLIVDEVHKFKKIEGARSNNLLELSSRFSEDDRYLVILSGTPVPNKVHDIAMTIKMLRSDIPEIKEVNIRTLARQIIEGSQDLAKLAKIRGYFVSHMEMKRMTEALVGHKKSEVDIESELTEEEQEIYEVILEDDDLTSSQKLQYLRQFLLNPALFDPSIEIKGTKIKELNEKIDALIGEGKSKIIVFTNSYIEGIIRGDNSILEGLSLPKDVSLYSIHGDRRESDDRNLVQEKINRGNEAMVVFVSGQTSDVGVDFSGADAVIEYNDPWSLYDKGQQIGRVFRPGLKKDIGITTFITGELEKGIREYIKAKQRAIEKLLNGVPLNQLEKRLIEKSEVVTDSGDIDISNEQEARGLIEFLSSNSQTLNRIFAVTKEIGEKEFNEKIVNTEWGEKYAETYLLCGSHAYQPNVNRLHATLMDLALKKNGQASGNLLILDLASGPEMLRRHVGQEYQGDQILSIDLNPRHFEENEGLWHVGGYSKLPESLQGECDFINLSLAFHYAKFDERLNLLLEMSKSLKMGGQAMISLPYSLQLKDKEKFMEALPWLGFEADQTLSGEATSGNTFMIDVLTIRKVGEPAGSLPEIKEVLSDLELLDSFKLKRRKISLEKQDRIVGDIILNGHPVKLKFNEEDQQLYTEEQNIISIGEALKSLYGKIEDIPLEKLAQTDEATEEREPMFVRIKYPDRYILFAKLPDNNGFVLIK